VEKLASTRLRVSVGTTPEDRREFSFDKSFRIGRVEDCDVCIKNEYVSRAHVEVACENGQWSVRDLHSSNGIFVDGKRVEQAPVAPTLTFRLGIAGPTVSLELDEPPPKDMVAHYVDHYFGSTSNQAPGEHTILVRQAFQKVQTKQKRKYGWIMAALGLCILGAAGYALYLRQQVGKQKAMAKDLFYAMKSLDLDIATVQKLVTDSHNQQGLQVIRKDQNRRKEMAQNYDRFLATLHIYNPKMTEQERLILRVARVFGECELDMPPGFVPEIQNYIKKWQSSGRLARAIRIAKENGYNVKIAEELLAQDLPPQFFYLALQESDFDPYISGPATRKGIAKGMWQFIPETATKYGLRIGPLADLRRPDPGDDRHHWDKETQAAAKYLKDLYSTDAQASGFLVMACYNWGEDYIVPLVRGMPANPKERNFWQLLSKYRDKIPQQTYDYVFYIASAAVIGENPRLFGFDFDKPLGHLDSK
jgi:membrane-bound lytic murein transglycosylase D